MLRMRSLRPLLSKTNMIASNGSILAILWQLLCQQETKVGFVDIHSTNK